METKGNKIRWFITSVMMILFLISLSIESETIIPNVICMGISLLWLVPFFVINRDWLERNL